MGNGEEAREDGCVDGDGWMDGGRGEGEEREERGQGVWMVNGGCCMAYGTVSEKLRIEIPGIAACASWMSQQGLE